MTTLAERMAKSSTDYCVNWAAMLICGVPEEKVEQKYAEFEKLYQKFGPENVSFSCKNDNFNE